MLCFKKKKSSLELRQMLKNVGERSYHASTVVLNHSSLKA